MLIELVINKRLMRMVFVCLAATGMYATIADYAKLGSVFLNVSLTSSAYDKHGIWTFSDC